MACVVYSVEFLTVWLYLNMHAILLQESIGPLDNQLNSLELGRGAYKRGLFCKYRGRREERQGTLHVTLLWCMYVCLDAHLHVHFYTSWLCAILSGLGLEDKFWTWFMDLFGFFSSCGFIVHPAAAAAAAALWLSSVTGILGWIIRITLLLLKNTRS